MKRLSRFRILPEYKSIMSNYRPPVNHDMQTLDRSFFKKDIPLIAAKFSKPQYLPKFIKLCADEIINVPNIKHIVTINDSKAILLKDSITKLEDCSPETQEKFKEFGIELEPYTLHLDYWFWKSDEILNAIIPKVGNEDVPSGFTAAGHLAHLNLRDEYKKYGKIIGEVILDKNPAIKTVVDKKNTIKNEFRTFPIELLAGEENYVVEQTESGCKFTFDFSKVYWNSRLAREHERLIEKFGPGEVVGDVMAGVGPFAVPSGKKGTIVLANDLNPESYKYLQQNIEQNKVESFVKAYNIDGRKFIEDAAQILSQFAQRPIEKRVTKRVKDKSGHKSIKQTETITVQVPKFYHHFVMNLPDSALTFLDAYIGLYSKTPEIKDEPGFKLPWIHVHCFEKFEPQEEPTDEELHRRIWVKICKLVNYELDMSKMEFHEVRMVSPTKPMFCVSFQLPEEVAFRNV
ncbi:conserved hypothetical protein [Lodderomyces elongisporus NRRL YB-4239]|uniref:tRNA (guanine(37)-N1)-methyltransferase n=1 Tax=Lodderomyces elongisporus (strain ATCC 11503 / CBS 2605 / JCM 1781 / NBRC 1676 / NRRL YB-4239) TaxID=379508 RepID=A5E4I9_LODEL|nr:conserved hypothetical protein [Lodderomyces elongisporus NRRL YB-4239]